MRRASLPVRIRALVAAVLVAAPLLVAAGSFSVIPVRILVAPRERAVAVTLTNLGDTPIALDAKLYQWQQRPDGSDQLSATDDLVLAPPLIRLQPKAQQVVRLALLRAADPQVQLAYRMIVRELPELAPDAQQSVAIPVALAMNLPIFVTPPGARWQVDCSARASVEGPQVRCQNTGNAAAVIRSARLERAGQVLARFEGAAYVLPGVTRPIALQPRVGNTALPARLVVTFEDDHQAAFELPAID